MQQLNKLTITQAQKGLQNKDFTSVELVQSCLTAIESLEPKLNAYVTLTKTQALKEAQLADTQIQNDPNIFQSKPLIGIPYALKDNFLVENIRTTASSKVLDNFIPPYTSTVAQKLRDAGAIILGKTNMDAWAHGSSTETSDYGTTKNPWDINKLPGGSSGGSAATVASHGCIFAIGSETAGSIRQPSSWCGITGLKPTYGRVSRYGVIAMGSSLDCPGPMTKNAEDAAIVLSVIAGQDPHDATTSPLPKSDYQKDLKNSIKGLKIGLPKEYFMPETQPGINDLVKKASEVLAKLGAELIEVSLLNPKYSIADYTIIQRAEVSSNLSRYDGIRFGNDRSFFGSEAKRRIMLGTYALSSGYYDAYYKRAQKVRMLLKQDFARVFELVDVIIAPTSPSTALPLGASQNHPMFGEISDVLVEASSLVGLTGINVPVGFIEGLPVGMQIIANHFCESTVLNLAHQYQLVTSWHKEEPIL